MPRPQITLESPLGEDLRLESFTLTEGQFVIVVVELRDGQRFFQGYATRFGAG